MPTGIFFLIRLRRVSGIAIGCGDWRHG